MATGVDMISNKALQEHWLRRFVAIVIDAVVVLIPVAILSLFLPPLSLLGWGFGLWQILFLLYCVALESFDGATFGKQLMKLKVVSLERPLDITAVLIRNISKIFIPLLFIDWIVGFATMGDPRQKYTDRLGGTTVKRTDPGGYAEEQFLHMRYVKPAPVHRYEPQVPSRPAEAAKPETEKEKVEAPPVPVFCQFCGARLEEFEAGKKKCPSCGAVF